MKKENNLDLIKKSGQEMYFDKIVAKKMIERENNKEHTLVSKIFESILITEFKNGKNIKLADLGAGAHPKRYIRFLQFLKENSGKLFWIDQSSLMLNHALKNTPQKFKEVIKYTEEEMVDFLNKRKESFDGLIFKYSFNYLISQSLKDWIKIIYEGLKKNGKAIANLHFYERGIRDRSYNAIYTINGKNIKSGYKPQNNDIIEVHFLQKPGDKSLKPKIFASTKIIYYDPIVIKKIASKIGFFTVKIFKNWEENSVWKDTFERLNPGLESKAKTFLLFEK